MQTLVLGLLLCAWLPVTPAARILVAFPVSSASHYSQGRRLVVELLARGHHVTYANGFGEKGDLGANYTDLVIGGGHQNDDVAVIRKRVMSFTSQTGLQQFAGLIPMIGQLNENFLRHPLTQQLIADRTCPFDLLVIEAFMNEAFLGLAHHFQVPMVVLSPLTSNLWTDVYTKNPMPPAYVPDIFTGFSGRMSFVERLTNTVVAHIMNILYYCFHLPAEEALLRKYFPDAPPLAELIQRHATIVLANSHPSFGIAKPLSPNIIEIGGYHLTDPKPLPSELQAFADSAKDGLILFSLGSNFQGVMVPQEIRTALLEVFAELAPCKFLVKFENETLEGKPDNVKISKWLPQNDLLAHPNMKLFITHGGMLSTTESIFHGVPVVGLPIFGDQSTNMAGAEKLGFGISLPLLEVTADKLLSAVREVLQNPKYRTNVRERSRLLRDQPMRPIDTAMYWLEYVLRHKHVEHLRTGALYLHWYQVALLDVYAVLFAGVLLAVLLPTLLIRRLCCRPTAEKRRQLKDKQQ